MHWSTEILTHWSATDPLIYDCLSVFQCFGQYLQVLLKAHWSRNQYFPPALRMALSKFWRLFIWKVMRELLFFQIKKCIQVKLSFLSARIVHLPHLFSRQIRFCQRQKNNTLTDAVIFALLRKTEKGESKFLDIYFIFSMSSAWPGLPPK